MVSEIIDSFQVLMKSQTELSSFLKIPSSENVHAVVKGQVLLI